VVKFVTAAGEISALKCPEWFRCPHPAAYSVSSSLSGIKQLGHGAAILSSVKIKNE